MINKLGEHYHEDEKKNVDKDVKTYLSILDRIVKEKLDASITVKPSQIGLVIDSKLFIQNLEKLALYADSLNLFVWVDMEGMETTTGTIKGYLEIHKKFKNIGIVLQSNLHRTLEDMDLLVANQAIIRLVKGAYEEPALLSIKDYEEIEKRFEELMKYLFEYSNNFAIATHDEYEIQKAKEFHKQFPKITFEFQFLRGAGDEFKYKLAKEGYHVAEYLPYGEHWIPYVTRRLVMIKRKMMLSMRDIV